MTPEAEGAIVLRLRLAGMDTIATTPLCARCPSGPAGCCAAPPALAWADLGRIANRGGAGWLRDEVAAGRLRPCSRGLAMTRAAGPHGVACTYLGPAGCALAPDRRSVTCNEYLCEDAYGEAERAGDPAAQAARAAHAELEVALAAWDAALAEAIEARGEAPSFDEAFFAWLGAQLDQAAGRPG